MIRIDFVFSYWIFFWFLLYYFGVFREYNPKFALLLGVLESALTVLLLFYLGSPLNKIIKYTFINIILKGVPPYLIWNTAIRWEDIYFTIGLFIIYCIWIHINHKTVTDTYLLLMDSYWSNKPGAEKTWPSYIYDQIFR